jgi:hypothetical protein
MDSETAWKGKDHPEPGGWQDDRTSSLEETSRAHLNRAGAVAAGPRDQSKLLELLGLINFQILSGHSLYVEVNGAVYKILYGGYWRSVFTGAEHYFLRCDEVADGMWMEGGVAHSKVDLAIRYTDAGWVVKGHSLKFMMSRD